ncbi:MAG: hypothetical protein AAFY33_09765 [Cyanobacteria bacterium J06643_4]
MTAVIKEIWTSLEPHSRIQKFIFADPGGTFNDGAIAQIFPNYQQQVSLSLIS